MRCRSFAALLALAVLALPLGAQAPDSTCLRIGRAARDSLARLHLKSVRDTTGLTAYQQRAYGSLSTILALKCTLPKPDTVVVPPAPSPAATIGLTLSLPTIQTRPTPPFMSFLMVAVDSAGQRLADSATVTLSDPTLAKLHHNRTARRYELYTETTGTRSGVLTITVTRGATSSSVTLTIVGPSGPVAAASVTLDYTAAPHWAHGFGAFAADTSTLCATVTRADGQVFLGLPSGVARYLGRQDSVGFSPTLNQTDEGVRAACAEVLPGTTGVLPILWKMAALTIDSLSVWYPVPQYRSSP